MRFKTYRNIHAERERCICYLTIVKVLDVVVTNNARVYANVSFKLVTAAAKKRSKRKPKRAQELYTHSQACIWSI